VNKVYIIVIIIIIIIKGGRGNDYKGGSLPLLNLSKEIKGEQVGMLPNILLEVAHLTTECALKLAHLKTFDIVQLAKHIRYKRILTTIGAHSQSKKR
jgi:hypothetical protein